MSLCQITFRICFCPYFFFVAKAVKRFEHCSIWTHQVSFCWCIFSLSLSISWFSVRYFWCSLFALPAWYNFQYPVLPSEQAFSPKFWLSRKIIFIMTVWNKSLKYFLVCFWYLMHCPYSCLGFFSLASICATPAVFNVPVSMPSAF